MKTQEWVPGSLTAYRYCFYKPFFPLLLLRVRVAFFLFFSSSLWMSWLFLFLGWNPNKWSCTLTVLWKKKKEHKFVLEAHKSISRSEYVQNTNMEEGLSRESAWSCSYSQLPLGRTRSGPAPTVRLREVSASEGDEVNDWSTAGTISTCPL